MTETTTTKIDALLQLLREEGDTSLEADDILEGSNNSFSVYNQEWLVLTENEADGLWDEQLESYIDECILPGLPEAYRMYFDYEAWKRDAKFDGRGHSLSGYDGNEHEIFFPNGEFFLAYRTN